MQFVESGHVESAVVLDGSAMQRSDPAGLKDPFLKVFFPVCALRMNTPGELEGVGIELEDRDPAEVVGVGVEHLVVVDFVVLPKNPFAIRLQVGLGRLALDLVAQDLLLAVGVRDVELINDEQSYGKNSAEDNHRKRRTIDAHSAGLHRR